jgi:predicted phosphodiesterase
MRYLVCGDIHGNLPALETVLVTARHHRFDACLFVGDLVGYGPDPLPCIAQLRDWHRIGRLAWVAGNHDLAARATTPLHGFIPEAAETLAWTRQQLRGCDGSREFLGAAPTAARVNDHIWLTHDSLAEPGSGTYQRDLRQAAHELATLQQLHGRVCFYGHTHVLRADVLENTGIVNRPHFTAHTGPDTDPAPLLLLPHQTALIGVGSVGIPKNRARLAEFLLLDTDDDRVWSVEKYAVDYPRYQTRARLHEQLIPGCTAAIVHQIARWL